MQLSFVNIAVLVLNIGGLTSALEHYIHHAHGRVERLS